MADAAARREARRRRILENAEYRLQRITGHPNRNEPQDERGKRAVDTQPAASNTTPNGILTNEPIMEKQNFDALISGDGSISKFNFPLNLANTSMLHHLPEINANIETDEPSLKADQMFASQQGIPNHISSGGSVQYQRISDRSCIPNDYSNAASFSVNHTNDLKFSPASRDPHGNSLLTHLERDTAMLNSPGVEEKSLLMDVMSSRLVYILLAIVVNIMTFLNLEHLFGTSIISPFVAVMIGRLFMCKHNDESQGNNMLVAALILSNCRPDFVKVIQRLKCMFSLFDKITRDLAVYIFTFVLLYTLISPYRENLGNPLAHQNEGEAIIADDMGI